MASESVLELVRQYVDDHISESLALLKELCRQPSVSAQHLGIEEMCALLVREMRKYGIETTVLPSPGNPAVFGLVKGDKPKTLLYYNHYDVQPPEPLDAWESPPFEPTIRNGRLYARGATDNKGNVAARLSALRAIRAVLGAMPITLKFIVEGEEEVGSPSLPKIVSNNLERLKADWVLWEDTLREGDIPVISLGSKGMAYLELKCRTANTDFHSAYAGVYPNAAWRLVSALSTMKDAEGRILIDGFYDDVRSFTSEEQALMDRLPETDLDAIKEEFDIMRFVQNVDAKSFRAQYTGSATCNISGIISGYTGKGSKTVIPKEATAKVDIRLVPNQRADNIVEAVRRHLKARGFEDIEVSSGWHDARPCISPIDFHALSALEESIKNNVGASPIVDPLSGGASPKWVASEILKVAVMGYGLGHPSSRVHAPNESVKIEDYVAQIKTIAEFMLRLGEIE